MLTKADEGGGGVQEPLILADVICEQPLIVLPKTDNRQLLPYQPPWYGMVWSYPLSQSAFIY